MDERFQNGEPGAAAPATQSAQKFSFDPRFLVPEPLFCCDAEGWLLWLNQAAEELTGQPAHRLVGYSFAALFPPENRDRLARSFVRRHLRETEEFYCEAPLLTASGEPNWVGMRVRRLRAPNGRLCYVCSAHNLQAIHSEIVGLKRRVRELKARAKEAAATVQLKSDFLATMSDEIRTPMNGVIGMSRLLLDTHLDRDQRMYAEVIENSGRTLLEFVNDILDFSKIESGKLEIAKLDFDLRVTVEAVAAGLAPRANGRDLGFACQVNHRVPSHVTGDPGRLRQVLLALGNMAINYAEQGDVALRVDLVEETAHEVVLRFGVGEAGLLGEGEEMEALLRCFSQPEARVPSRHGSAGLSLAIARKVVALMGGEAGVRHDESGHGHILWFMVPLAKAVAPAAAQARQSVDLSGLRILVADPAKSARTPTVESLRAWGCSVDEVEDGLQAMDRLRRAAKEHDPFALVLVDLELPVLNAEALAEAIHSVPALAKTQLVLFTNLGRPGDAARADDWGYAAYFVKPVPAQHLHDALLEVVRRGSETETAEAAAAFGLVTRHTVDEQRRQNLHVLLIEDNAVNRLVAISALHRMGYAPEVVESAAEAVARLEAQRFEVILMDVSDAEQDCGAIVKAIRAAEPEGRRTPLLALTAQADPEHRGRLTAAGVDGFLAKPVDLEAMCSLVEHWTRHGEAAPPPAVAEPETAETAQAADGDTTDEIMPVAHLDEVPEPFEIAPVVVSMGSEAEVAPVATAEPEPIAEVEAAVVAVAMPEPEPIAEVEAAVVAVATAEPEPIAEVTAYTPPVAETAPAPPPVFAAVEPVVIERPTPAAGLARIIPFPDRSAAPAEVVAVPAEVVEAPAAAEETDGVLVAEIGNLPVLDADQLSISSMGSPAVEALLVRTFFANTQGPLERLRAAIERADAEGAEHEAEGLTRLCRALGAARCAAVCERIGRLARRGEFTGLRLLAIRADAELRRIEAAFAERSQAA